MILVVFLFHLQYKIQYKNICKIPNDTVGCVQGNESKETE